MLIIGKAGTAGAGKKTMPVLRDGSMVASLLASNWKEAATAVVEGWEWVFGKRGGELNGRWADEPEGSARLRARRTSFWKGTWALDLEGTPIEVRTASAWKGTHRFLVAGRQVAESGVLGFWSQRPTLTADESLPLAHQVFLLWFELVMARRRTATTATVAAAGAGGAAAAGS